MTTKTLLLAAAATAAVALSPVAASATTFVNGPSGDSADQYALTPLGDLDAGTGSLGTLSSNVKITFTVGAEDIHKTAFELVGSSPFLYDIFSTTQSGTIAGSKYQTSPGHFAYTPLSYANTAANGALSNIKMVFARAGVYTVYVKFAAGHGTGTYTTGYRAGGHVPEPASWALMLVGVAGVGAAMRRRNRALAA
jgi:hypothetical protein